MSLSLEEQHAWPVNEWDHMKYLVSCLKENPMDASRNKDDN